MKLKIIPIGNSFGLILPKETLAKLNVAGGDAVFITETPDGFRITLMTRNFALNNIAAFVVYLPSSQRVITQRTSPRKKVSRPSIAST